jgi:hypothetical protein
MNYFLVIFIDFFHFFNSNSNLNFCTGCYRWGPLPYPAVAAVTAVYRAVTDGKKRVNWFCAIIISTILKFAITIQLNVPVPL